MYTVQSNPPHPPPKMVQKQQHQQPLSLLSLLLIAINLPIASAAGKTHIYIDQIALYPSLDTCVQDRLSAIIRAQASGCGDDRQLTSFACFCVDSSTEYASIISTAVNDACGRRVATATATATAAVEAVESNVQSALEVFGSYCAKSTELTRCMFFFFFFFLIVHFAFHSVSLFTNIITIIHTHLRHMHEYISLTKPSTPKKSHNKPQ